MGIRCFGCNQPLCQTEEQVFSICLQRKKARVKRQQIHRQPVQPWRCFKTHWELIKLLGSLGLVNTRLLTGTVLISRVSIPDPSCLVLKSQPSQTGSNQMPFSEWRRMQMSNLAELYLILLALYVQCLWNCRDYTQNYIMLLCAQQQISVGSPHHLFTCLMRQRNGCSTVSSHLGALTQNSIDINTPKKKKQIVLSL